MRSLALVNAVVVGLLAASAAVTGPAAPVLLAAAVAITVSGNGLAFTAVAELSGQYWSGRALGAHNTAQSMVSMATPPLLGLFIAATGYGAAFLLAAAFAAIAIVVIPDTAGRTTWGLRRVDASVRQLHRQRDARPLARVSAVRPKVDPRS